ncbi:1433 protein [Hepatospora eriocheir]|uniref:1433 protein n=1 Tax=Hepatospora eriocheir TaxID=1081669 RepID=A0A1X0Q8Y4_9MICR|nr:1433 protein [Hepatospora eriocheir]
MEVNDLDDAIKRLSFYKLADRHEDMARETISILEMMHKEGKEMDEFVRENFSLSHKNMLSPLRNSLRALMTEADKYKDDKENHEYKILKEIIVKITNNIMEISDGVLDAIEKFVDLKEKEDQMINYVYFIKIKGDFYRYKAEVTIGPSREEYRDMSFKYYSEAREKGNFLKASNPIWLGLALNLSVLYYETFENVEEALKLAQESFEAAIQQLDILTDENYNESTLIMQLLRDNITLWTVQAKEKRMDSPLLQKHSQVDIEADLNSTKNELNLNSTKNESLTESKLNETLNESKMLEDNKL